MKLKFTIPILLLVWVFAIQLSAQTGMVKGNVSSTDGFPLIGANVSVKGATVGTITDLDGNYEIKAKAGDILLFSYVGYEDVESPVGNDLVVNVVLGAGVSLQEVVVTALGISREKKALGYAVEQLNADEISRTGQTNLVSALAGKVAGVQIQNTSGAPGAGTDILIRGITSLDPNRSNRPLYIVDGVEISDNTNVLPITPSAGSNAVSSSPQSAFSNRVVDLNPEDIESMTVLKGAQATALYGIRAANGAIVITSKKGKLGKPQIGVYYGQGWENVNKTPYIQTKHVDGHFNTSLPRGYEWDTWGPRKYDGETYVFNDPYQTFFTQGSTRSFGANVSTGTDKFTFRLSGDRYSHDGIIPGTYWNKTNFGFSGTTQITEKLHVSASLRYAKTGGNRPHTGDKSILSNMSYVTPVADMTQYKTPYTYLNNFSAGIIDHPLFLTEKNSYVDDVNRYIAGLTLN
jgi:TonB-dependent SusC/RagA subfamily outer membrane receptor